MEFRAAEPDDVAAVVALVESAYRGDSSRSGWTTEADLLDGQRTDAREVRDALQHLLLAERDGRLVACCLLDAEGRFGMFAVRPDQQGLGTGGALLAHAEAVASARGCDQVELQVLSVRTELIAFYVRRGYRRTGEQRPFPYGDERFGRPRRDDLVFDVLVKPLDAPAP